MDTQKKISEIAEEYTCDGYKVTVSPKEGELPDFASGMSPDLLAEKDDEKVLVQIKMSRKEAQADPDTLRLAKVVNEQPGWRYDLVVLNGSTPSLEVPEKTSEPSVTSIRELIESVEEQHSKEPENPYNLVVAWSAFEAAMRHVAAMNDIELKNFAPSYVMRVLYVNGLLEKEELERAEHGLKIRNAVVHGMTVESFERELCDEVIEIAGKLLESRSDADATRVQPLDNASKSH